MRLVGFGDGVSAMIKVQRPFFFHGRIPNSKSWLNRALILRSIHPQIRILDWEPSEFDGEDVLALDRALKRLAEGGKEFDIGESGTGFRFLLARLSILKGEFHICASERLLKRPHSELWRILSLLRCQIRIESPTTIKVECAGWPDRVPEFEVDASESSQFASALLLAGSHRTGGIDIALNAARPQVSAGYLEMTREMVDMVVKHGRRVLVPEADASSAAALAAVVIASGHRGGAQTAMIRKAVQSLGDQVEKTKQPDRAFFRISTNAYSESGLGGFEQDLSGAPDLFPTLSALAVFSKADAGPSTLSGAPHLRVKESDRIREIEKLFELIGVRYDSKTDGITVYPATEEQRRHWAKRRRLGIAYAFAPPSDHRLAFAATVLAAGGVPIALEGRGMVAKSFPQFWSIIEGDAPRVAVIGHRGTGKSEAVRRWAHMLGARATAIDLDREIERLSGKSVREVFERDGEAELRWFEKKAWNEIDDESRRRVGALIVACGAGFDVTTIDESWTRVWLKRATDRDGRVFFDRPRLDPELTPIQESIGRFLKREPRYASVADRVYEAVEGSFDDLAERVWVRDLFDDDSVSPIGGTVSLRPETNIGDTCERLQRWGVSRIEIRDDLFKHDRDSEAWSYFRDLPTEKLLISFRDPLSRDATLAWLRSTVEKNGAAGIAIDWPLDQSKPGEPIPEKILSFVRENRIGFVASFHGAAQTILSGDPKVEWTLTKLQATEKSLEDQIGNTAFAMKLACEVDSFSDLIALHRWAQASVKSRVLLPMTSLSSATPVERPFHARWSWYRAHFGINAPLGLSFWREDTGTSADQPTFAERWHRQRATKSPNFAAVLGEPVHHSHSPAEHRKFFFERGMPIYSIRVAREEASVAIPFLFEIGLRAAAVTAPLKDCFVEGQTLNTWVRSKGKDATAMTDTIGFQLLWSETSGLRKRFDRDVAPVIWGGGGVLSAIKEVVPNAVAYSASKGSPRDTADAYAGSVAGPTVVIWAAGNEKGNWPSDWRPALIIDLSYTENSAARGVAIETSARYVSGLAMFRAQAAAQREFWQKHLET